RPAGAGPVPALVVVHTCGGLKLGHRAARQEIPDWTEAALERGHVVVVIGHLSSRGGSPEKGRKPAHGGCPSRDAKDALQAGEHLRKLSIVDQDRVAVVGFSWGAMVGLFVSSSSIASQLSASRFGAVVGFYPVCHFPGAGQFRQFTWLRTDT